MQPSSVVRVGRVLFACVAAASVAMAGACESEEAPAAGVGSDASATGDSSRSDASQDSSTTPGDADADEEELDASDPTRTLILKDESKRFATRRFTDYTCPSLPGLGRVILWTVPMTSRPR